MLNKTAYALGSNRSCIRDLFEYGRQRAAIVGPENVYDYSLGNPSIPSPPEVNQAIVDILRDTDSLAVHGYTSASGDYATRKAISDDLNQRYQAQTRPEDFFLGCGAAPELVSVFRALAVPEGEILAIGVQYLRVEGAFYCLIALLFLLYGFWRAVERPGMSVVLTVISLGLRVVLAYGLSAIPALGAAGIWVSIPIGWAVADLAGCLPMVRWLRRAGNR